MTEINKAPEKAKVSDAPLAGDDIAPDLATLMDRMERVRKFLCVEREYSKLVLMGGWFILVGSILTPNFPWRMIALLGLAATPWLFGWYNMPKVRLANGFRNEVLPFFLRDYGRWNYAITGTHFSREHLKKTGLINPSDSVGLGNIMTGERFGVPLQMAVLASWPRPRFGGLYRGKKANFEGWAASIRLPDMSQDSFLILPKGKAAPTPDARNWKRTSLTPSHDSLTPPESVATLPQPLLARLLTSMMDNPQTSYALYQGVLWMLVPSSTNRFNQATQLAAPLNIPAPYESARKDLADMFAVIDRIVWVVAS